MFKNALSQQQFNFKGLPSIHLVLDHVSFKHREGKRGGERTSYCPSIERDDIQKRRDVKQISDRQISFSKQRTIADILEIGYGMLEFCWSYGLPVKYSTCLGSLGTRCSAVASLSPTSSALRKQIKYRLVSPFHSLSLCSFLYATLLRTNLYHPLKTVARFV